jgi:hypothetical protein
MTLGYVCFGADFYYRVESDLSLFAGVISDTLGNPQKIPWKTLIHKKKHFSRVCVWGERWLFNDVFTIEALQRFNGRMIDEKFERMWMEVVVA